jgi:flagellar biosynthesis protein FlhF
LLDRIGRRLIEQRFDPDAVRQFIDELHDAEGRGQPAFGALCSHLVHLVAGRIATGPPIQLLPATRRVVALVGPTGVGKTTTLVKLAAGFHMQGKRVGLIAADTYRVAAVGQLRTYAEVMELPMEVVAAGGDFGESIGRLEAMDLVLLDSAGCSPRDAEHIQRLTELLQRAQVDETHLVVSAASSPDSIILATENFGVMRPRTLILTKIDEVVRPGSLWPLLSDRRLPLSYVTHGQNVPHDIFLADRQRLAEFMVGAEIADAARQ